MGAAGSAPLVFLTAVEIEPVVIDLAPRDLSRTHAGPQAPPHRRRSRPHRRGRARACVALTTPWRIQEFVIGLHANFEEEGDTLRSVRGVLRHRRAHCIEAAFTAACALWLQGEPPLADGPRRPRAIRTMSLPSSGAMAAGAPSPRATMSGCAGATRSIAPRASSRCRTSTNTPTSIARRCAPIRVPVDLRPLPRSTIGSPTRRIAGRSAPR